MLSFPASLRIALWGLLQYFVSSIRAGELFFHLEHRSGASPFVRTSSDQANGCPVLQPVKRMWLLGDTKGLAEDTKGLAGDTKGMTEGE